MIAVRPLLSGANHLLVGARLHYLLAGLNPLLDGLISLLDGLPILDGRNYHFDRRNSFHDGSINILDTGRIKLDGPTAAMAMEEATAI